MPTLTHNRSSRPSPAPRDGTLIRRLTECRSEFMRYFQRRLSSSEEAEDAFQDFCVKVLRTARGPHDPGKVDAWLRRVMRNSLIDHYRRRATQRRGMDAFEAEPREIVYTSEVNYDEKPCTCLREALAVLRSDYAEIIRRIDLEEQPREAVAADLALTVNNIGVRLYRARRAMKVQIEKRFSDCDCQSETHVACVNRDHNMSKPPAIREAVC